MRPSLLQKAREYARRCGPAAKFVLKVVAGYAVPGGSAVVELVEKAIDCAHETARDSLEATGADLERVEAIFDGLLGDLAARVDELKSLQHDPELARKTFVAALAAEERDLQAAEKIKGLCGQMDCLLASVNRLTAGQEELIDLQRRSYGTLIDYLQELYDAGVSPRKLKEQLDRIEAAIFAQQAGRTEEAVAAFTDMSRAEPQSVALAVGLAAAQSADHQLLPASKTLVRAARLRPHDAELGKLAQAATRLSRTTDPDKPPPSVPRPKTGDTLHGWSLLQLLGSGGWGQVFLAEKAGQRRALKILHAELSLDPTFERRFKREMATLMNLGSHPNLIRIDQEHLYDKAPDWNCWYYVMEYVEGMSLEAYLGKKGRLSWEQALPLFRGVADGLAQAHRHGIIHRDIKPANFLIRSKSSASAQERSVLVDFGLAGEIDPHTRSAGYTALFAAPEQVRTGQTSSRSDVFSFAATLYYALLYDQPAKRDKFKARLLGDLVPPAVRGFLEKCLDPDADDRPADASAVAAFLANPVKEEVVLDLNEFIDENPALIGKLDALLSAQQRAEQEAMDKRFRAIEKQIHQELDAGRLDWLPFRVEAALQLRPDHRDMLALQKKLGQPRPGHIVANSLNMRFAFIPAGSFHMGSTSGGADDERPAHKVTLRQAYFLGVTPVTQAQWQAVMGNTPAPHFKGADRPMESITWEECVAFCKKLSERDGRNYRLPTEAEWEYACRAGTTAGYFFGDDAGKLSEYGWFDGNSGKQTQSVGLKKPNLWGLRDMSGNVWEWCVDWYGAYSGEEMTNPQGLPHGEYKVLRGGSWFFQAGDCRSAYRDWFAPGDRSNHIGFRVLLPLD